MGWGYSIDYDKAIADDEATIAHMTSEAVMIAATKLIPELIAQYPNYTYWEVYSVITWKVEGMEDRAKVFGLTLDDIRCLAIQCNENRTFVYELVGDDGKRGDYQRAIDMERRFNCFPLYTEEQRKKALSKARASLSRHKRNKTKFGG